MFEKIRNNNSNHYNNYYNDYYNFSLFNDIIIPLCILLVLISTATTTTIVGIIVKQEDEKSNILLLLPLIILVILNNYRLELNVIRMSVMCLALGYVIYDILVLYSSKLIITNLIYCFISLIQLICGVICLRIK